MLLKSSVICAERIFRPALVVKIGSELPGFFQSPINEKVQVGIEVLI